MHFIFQAHPPIKCMLIWSFSLSTEASLRPQRMQQKSSPWDSALSAPESPLGDVAAAADEEEGDLWPPAGGGGELSPASDLTTAAAASDSAA